MSNQEDQTTEVGAKETQGPAGPVTLFFIIGFALSLVVGWGIFPKLLYSQKHQPVEFNHVLHNDEVSDGCESCHYFREDGSFAGIPTLESCMECHEELEEDEHLPNLFSLLDDIAEAERRYVKTAKRLDEVGRGVLLVDNVRFKFGDAKTHLIALACAPARAKLGSSIPIMTAMIATTIINSMSVNARLARDRPKTDIN